MEVIKSTLVSIKQERDELAAEGRRLQCENEKLLRERNSAVQTAISLKSAVEELDTKFHDLLKENAELRAAVYTHKREIDALQSRDSTRYVAPVTPPRPLLTTQRQTTFPRESSIVDARKIKDLQEVNVRLHESLVLSSREAAATMLEADQLQQKLRFIKYFGIATCLLNLFTTRRMKTVATAFSRLRVHSVIERMNEINRIQHLQLLEDNARARRLHMERAAHTIALMRMKWIGKRAMYAWREARYLCACRKTFVANILKMHRHAVLRNGFNAWKAAIKVSSNLTRMIAIIRRQHLRLGLQGMKSACISHGILLAQQRKQHQQARLARWILAQQKRQLRDGFSTLRTHAVVHHRIEVMMNILSVFGMRVGFRAMQNNAEQSKLVQQATVLSSRTHILQVMTQSCEAWSLVSQDNSVFQESVLGSQHHLTPLLSLPTEASMMKWQPTEALQHFRRWQRARAAVIARSGAPKKPEMSSFERAKCRHQISTWQSITHVHKIARILQLQIQRKIAVRCIRAFRHVHFSRIADRILLLERLKENSRRLSQTQDRLTESWQTWRINFQHNQTRRIALQRLGKAACKRTLYTAIQRWKQVAVPLVRQDVLLSTVSRMHQAGAVLLRRALLRRMCGESLRVWFAQANKRKALRNALQKSQDRQRIGALIRAVSKWKVVRLAEEREETLAAMKALSVWRQTSRNVRDAARDLQCRAAMLETYSAKLCLRAVISAWAALYKKRRALCETVRVTTNNSDALRRSSSAATLYHTFIVKTRGCRALKLVAGQVCAERQLERKGNSLFNIYKRVQLANIVKTWRVVTKQSVSQVRRKQIAVIKCVSALKAADSRIISCRLAMTAWRNSVTLQRQMQQEEQRSAIAKFAQTASLSMARISTMDELVLSVPEIIESVFSDVCASLWVISHEEQALWSLVPETTHKKCWSGATDGTHGIHQRALSEFGASITGAVAAASLGRGAITLQQEDGMVFYECAAPREHSYYNPAIDHACKNCARPYAQFVVVYSRLPMKHIAQSITKEVLVHNEDITRKHTQIPTVYPVAVLQISGSNACNWIALHQFLSVFLDALTERIDRITLLSTQHDKLSRANKALKAAKQEVAESKLQMFEMQDMAARLMHEVASSNTAAEQATHQVTNVTNKLREAERTLHMHQELLESVTSEINTKANTIETLEATVRTQSEALRKCETTLRRLQQEKEELEGTTLRRLQQEKEELEGALLVLSATDNKMRP